MFTHAHERYPRSVHLRFVAAQDFMIRRCMPQTPQVSGSTDDMLAYSTGFMGRKQQIPATANVVVLLH